MNKFTKEELSLISESIFYCKAFDMGSIERLMAVHGKVLEMIDSYDSHDANWIAKSHLKEASSLISHAMCLLELDFK